MSNATYMKELLRPLGVYKLEDSFVGRELESIGQALDLVQEELERVQREMCLTTARDAGLLNMAALFSLRPVISSAQQQAEALAALSRIGADSFTLHAINSTIGGCGLNAAVVEGKAPGTVIVRFPDVPGIPEGFDRLQRIIEDILPAHLDIQYLFWYVTWKELEQRNLTWQAVQDQNMTWEEFETLVS